MSIETMSPSSIRRFFDGIPCTTSWLIDVQMLAGKL